MNSPLAAAQVLLLAAQISHASQSIVHGRLIENEPMKEAPEACLKDTHCSESWYKSLIDVAQVLSGAPVSGRIMAVGKQEASLMAPESGVARLFVLSSIDAYEHRELLQAEYFLVDAATPVSPHSDACNPFDREAFRTNLEQAFEAASFDRFLATYGDHGPVDLVIENEYDEERPVSTSTYGRNRRFITAPT